MAHLEHAFHDHRLNRFGELEQTQQVVEVVEARVVQDQLARSFLSGPDLDRGPEAFRRFLFQAEQVAVRPALLARRPAAQLLRGEGFGFANREPATGDSLGRLDLARAV